MSKKQKEKSSHQSGFTLIELMITMVVFVLAIAAASQIFVGLLTQFKQQSKIAETNIEGVVGLELLRRDIEHAGYGLPWNIPVTAPYSEVPAGSDGNAYNDCSGVVPCNPPRALVIDNLNAANHNSTDVLVIKAVNVARNAACYKWTHLGAGDVKTTWVPACENVNKYSVSADPNCAGGASTENTVRIIVISPGSTTANSRTLVVNDTDNTDWDTIYSATSNFDPTVPTETSVIYGVGITGGGGNLRMPFNRADYYISTANVPSRCATNTGVLLKNVLSQNVGSANAGKRDDPLPLLDCVADMQVIFGLDNDNDGDFEPGAAGSTDVYSDDLTGLTAAQVRDIVKEVRVYILAHEGQRDLTFTYEANPVTVGEFGLGRSFNFTAVASPIADWQNYRWKVYTIIVKPNNLS